MLTVDITELTGKLRTAMLDGADANVASMQNELMGVVASALVLQDKRSLRELKSDISTLLPVARRYGDGSVAERWRAVWELVAALSDVPLQLDQDRVVKKNDLEPYLLSLADDPGMTPLELAAKLNRELEEVQGKTDLLDAEGLVTCLPGEITRTTEGGYITDNSSRRYFLHGYGRTIGKRLLALETLR